MEVFLLTVSGTAASSTNTPVLELRSHWMILTRPAGVGSTHFSLPVVAGVSASCFGVPVTSPSRGASEGVSQVRPTGPTVQGI